MELLFPKTCSRWSANLQNSMSSNVTTYTDFHSKVSNDMGLARRCIDSDNLDSAVGEACCGIATYPDCIVGNYMANNGMCPMDDRQAVLGISSPYELPGVSLADPSCAASNNESKWVVNNAVFDCEQLGTCSVTCQGPRRRLLNAASEHCSCAFEWYLHSKWMANSFAFLLYVFMNIARVLFFSSITRLLWKHIYPTRFTILVTCDSGGLLVAPPGTRGSSHGDLMNAIQYGSDADDSTYHEIHAKLKACLRNFYLSGCARLFGSILANGVWIYALAVTSQALTPHFWKQ